MRLFAVALSLLFLAAPASAQDWTTRCRAEAPRGMTAACEKALEREPRNPELHALLGEAYFAVSFYGEGLQALREAIAASNGAPEYRYRFAAFASLVNEYVQAADELELVVAARPRDVKSWSLMADCYRYMKNDAQALRASRAAAELGDAAEAYALADRFATGRGVARDPQEELRWLEKSARSGYIAAMQELASFYADGRPGIPADSTKQRYWENAARAAAK